MLNDRQMSGRLHLLEQLLFESNTLNPEQMLFYQGYKNDLEQMNQR